LLSVLNDIDRACRQVVKIDSTPAEVQLAEKIREIVWTELGMHQ
jgi:hypothetical protein